MDAKPIKVALVLIGTGHYCHMFPRVVLSARKHFLPSCQVTYIGISDREIPTELFDVGVHVPSCVWPEPTLWRYRFMLGIEATLREHDYVFYLDVDTEFIGAVGEEILGDLVATIHQGCLSIPRQAYAFEQRELSRAYISPDEPATYCTGIFQGGRTAVWLDACRTMDAAMQADEANGICAIWHDESHWNRYLIDHPPTILLDGRYACDEGGLIPDTRIKALHKDHVVMRSTDCDILTEGRTMRVAVIGLGKLGQPMVAVFAAAGHEVFGADLSPSAVAGVLMQQPPVQEPQLADLLSMHHARIRATTDLTEAVVDAELIFLIVPTPSQEDGTFSNRYLLDACRAIAKQIQGKVVVVVSTVQPGALRNEIVSCLESQSGLSCPRDFGLCYNPEFIALGNVVEDLQHPDFILIGESDAASGEKLAAFYHEICPWRPVARMSWESAEVCKIGLNGFVTTKISYANMISEICERLPHAAATDTLHAMGLDHRIGNCYLKPGTAFGGPCFPRDSRALAALCQTLGVGDQMPLATQAVNDRQTDRILEIIRANVLSFSKVAVLGLSYKPGTYITEESAGVALCQKLVADDRRYVVTACDTLAHPDILGVVVTDTPQEAIAGANVIVLTLPGPDYSAYITAELGSEKPPQLIIDCWGVMWWNNMPETTKYVRMGNSQ